MMKNKLSACMIVKNEQSCIENCLAPLRSYVDEIVVVDTGSTDRTIALASSYADKVCSFAWADDFSVARNFTAAQAANDWILSLDADETVTAWDRDDVGRFIAEEGARRTGGVEIISTIDEAGGQKRVHDRLSRLFNRQYFHFTGSIHEQLTNADGQFISADVAITLAHSGYTDAEIRRKDKTARNIALLGAALEKKSGDCYLLYQLGKSHELAKNNPAALACFESALQNVPDYQLLYVRDLVISYGYALHRAGDVKRALTVEAYSGYYAKSPDYQFLLGYLYMMNGQFTKAAQTFLSCTALQNGQMEGVTSFLPLYNIGVIFECLGKTAEALQYYRMCVGYAKAAERIRALGGA